MFTSHWSLPPNKRAHTHHFWHKCLSRNPPHIPVLLNNICLYCSFYMQVKKNFVFKFGNDSCIFCCNILWLFMFAFAHDFQSKNHLHNVNHFNACVNKKMVILWSCFYVLKKVTIRFQIIWQMLIENKKSYINRVKRNDI